MSTEVPRTSPPVIAPVPTGVRTGAPLSWREWWRPPSQEGDTLWGVSARDRWVLTALLVPMGVMIALHGWQWAETERSTVTIVRPSVEIAPASPNSDPPTGPAAVPYVFQLNVNEATWIEWAQLDGIGPTLAKRIVADRKERGPFQSVEDLRRVKGIGAKTIDKMRSHLTFSPAETAANE